MFGHETRPHHFLLPVLIFLIGGGLIALPGSWDVWDWIGGLILASGASCVFFLVYTAVKDKQLAALREHYSHDLELSKLTTAQKTTKIVVDKSDLTGYMQQSFNKLNIPPAKLLKFARGVLVEGRPLTIREWTPLNKGKDFSDPQWRTLISFMKNPDWDDKRIKFIVPIHPSNEKDGYELTAAGQKWLTDVLEQAELHVFEPV